MNRRLSRAPGRRPGWCLVTALIVAAGVLPLAAQPGQPAAAGNPTASDFDIRGPLANAMPGSSLSSLSAGPQQQAIAHLTRLVPNLTIRWSALTGAPSRIYSLVQPLTGPQALPALQVAQDFLAQNHDLLNLTLDDLAGARVSRQYVTQHNGLTHLTIQQQVQGLDVFGAALQVNVDRDGRILSLSGEPLPLAAFAGMPTTPAIDADSAGAYAAAAAGVASTKSLSTAGLLFFPQSAGLLRLAWDVTVEDADTPNVYRTLVDAADGTVLWRRNLTQYNHIPAHGLIFPSDNPNPDTPTGTATGCCVPRVDASFTGEGFFPHADPHYDWWNGSGLARTTTISNNVQAQEDRDGNNTGGFRPTAGTGEDFTFNVDFTMDPSVENGTVQNQSAGITNMFYWDNRLHDIYYRFGFDEASGNFQKDNFGLGGSSGDPIIADAQDNRDGNTPSLCNSNFFTPGDGSSPRMQMFICNNASPERDGAFENLVVIHEWTHGLSNRLITNLTNSQGGGMGEGWSDFTGLAITSEAGDDLRLKYPRAQWFYNNVNGNRIEPYSTDPNVHTRTYGDMNDTGSCAVSVCSNNASKSCTKDSDCGAGNTCNATACSYPYQCETPVTTISQGPCQAEVHATGEIWANALWIARANMVWKYGFATGGDTALQLIVDGMKLSPSDPDILDARDAILQADQADYAGANACLLWDAFAKSGMGLSALSTGSADINPLEAFDVPSTCSPNIRVSGPVDFGNVCSGGSKTSQLEVSNTGSGDLIVKKVSRISGSTAITVDPNPATPVVIAAGDHLDFSIVCNPAVTGVKTAVIRIESNDADQPELDLTYTCSTAAPTLTTTIADSGSFGDVCRGDFKDLPMTLGNSGGCDLSITGIGSSATEFQIASTVTYPLVIAAGASTQVPVRLAPTTLGPKSADISFVSDSQPAAAPVHVTGNVPPGDVRVTGSTAFGDVCAGVLAEKTVNVCNVGKCDLAVTSAAFDPACADFTLVNNPFPATVSHDSCNDLVIRFTPTSVGPKSCTLVISTDDPDTPKVSLLVTGNVPAPSIDVPPDQAFPATVIQSVGSCTSGEPFPVSNTGQCPLTITNVAITDNPAEYSLSGLPSFPILLEQGHIAGDGSLANVFAPQTLDRDRTGAVSVTYLSDPILNTSTTITRALCGEGVRTGARVLVTAGGVPLATVEQIKLSRINANRNKNLLDTVDTARNLTLQTVTPAAPCTPFQFHREYATVGNPIQLLPGAYNVTVTAVVNGKRVKKTVGFNVDTCGFNANIVVNF